MRMKWIHTLVSTAAAAAALAGLTVPPAQAAPTPRNPPPATGSPQTAANHSFHGIYAFSGGNSAQLAADPDVAGRSLVYYWAQLEPRQGLYRWDLVDKDIKPWAAAGKKVILRVSTAGWASWDKTADSAHGTPTWVYAQGVKSVPETDGAVLPQYWNPAFEHDLTAFIKAFATRYDGNAHIAAVDISVGIGGETKPDSHKNPNLLKLWQSIGYTDQIWWSYTQQAITTYTSAFHRTPLALMPDKTFLGTTPGYDERKIVTYAIARGIWLQDNGVVPGRTLSTPWGQTPIIAEMRGPTSQTGDNLKADLNAALSEHPALILVFTTDLTNPANRALIHSIAIQAHTTSNANGQPVPVNSNTTAQSRPAPTASPHRHHTHPACRPHLPSSAIAAKPQRVPTSN